MDCMSLTESCNLEMDLKILNISFQSGDVLIKFQGTYLSDSEFDYHILQNEIQRVTKTTEDIDIGQFCLVQDKPFGTWHRGKILDKVNQKSEVALIDQGNVIKVPSSQIASTTGELFILPPKVVNGIISNLLPLVEKWPPRAVNYFSSLVGQQLHGNVKTFLPHQVILLEIPKVISHAIELCLAKYVDSETFCLLVELLHKFPANSHCKQMPDLLQQKEICPDVTPDSMPSFQKLLDHLRPKICTNSMEKIKISAAISPDHFFCHVLSWEMELSKLTASMGCHYASAVTGTSSSLGSFGILCAAKRIDGSWYRGVIQKLISCNDMKIWFIDIGSSEIVPITNVQKLESEFLSLPMMTIPCALFRDNDHKESVKNVQLALFKEALMGRVVIGHIKDYSEERLYYLSLYNADFELSADCHLTDKHVPSFSLNPYTATAEPVIENCQNISVPETSTSIEMEYNESVSYKSVKMDLESVHVAYVEYVINPSNFWIRIDECQKNFTEMMAGIAEKYNKCELMEMVLQDPKPGQLCCALYALDGHYYRAVVTEVLSSQISVYFIDFGNTESVPFYDVKVLLPQFRVLPALAMCCSLAYACPFDDVWVKTANDFFKQTVNGKALLCHVVAKQKYKYVVEMRLSESSNSSDIVTLLVKSGFAEFWKVDLNSNSINLHSQFSDYNTQHEKLKRTFIVKGKRTINTSRPIGEEALVSLDSLTLKLRPVAQRSSFCTPVSDLVSPGIFTIYFKQHIFKPGAVMDVKVSHVDSPASFWCQVSDNASKLSTLMKDLQKFYSCSDCLYQHGQVACVAKSSSNGKYYRAAIVKYVSTYKCVVIFIDYGNTEKLLISELREIKPQFLELEGQAFRCSLSEVFSPPSVPFEWSVNACEDFKSLVQSTPVVMKCTIVALFSSGSEDLCNAVNLETCFGNPNKILTDKGHLVLRKNVRSLHLHSYCYSSFDLEVGSREDVYVSFIYNTGRFYCHLLKNEKIFDTLMKTVVKLGKKLKPATKPTELCLVKHDEDGNFYRVLSCPVKSSSLFLAFFVDFGDSQMVKNSELLPIPEDAGDILFQPMQAIPCYLAGMKESPLTIEAKAWFEEQSIDRLLNAVVVARNNEGQLELELYSENISINQEIKKIQSKSIVSKEKLTVCEDSNTIKNQHESDSHDSLPRSTLHKKSDSVHITKSIDLLNDKSISCSPKLVKSVDLPRLFLEADTTCLVYASHVDSPSSFFVQLAKQEVEIFQLVEELNKMSFQVINERDLQKDLVVVAQYPDDEAYYRAEIKDVLQDRFCVEFIDYGNKANVDSSCIFILPEKFLTIPRLSIPAFLTGIQKLQGHAEWSNNVTELFSEKVKSEPFSCKFMCKHDPQWEIDIILEGRSLSETLIQSFQCSSKPPAAITKDCLLKSDFGYFNISNESAVEEAIVDENINVPRTKTLKPGLVEKVKNISLSESGTLFVTLANFSEESKLNSQISATIEQFGNRLSVKEIKEGMVCLAKSEKMQVWLRASIEKLMPREMRMMVSFVDHGASEILSVHNAKKLSLEALSIPKRTIVCKWTGTEEIGQNVFAAHLESILQKEIRIIFLEFLECMNAWKVEILVDGLLLLQYLQSLADINVDKTNSHSEVGISSCQIPRNHLKSLEVCPGFITSFNSPSSFFVQLTDSVYMMDTLSQLMQIQDELTPIAGDSLKPGSSCVVRSFDEQEWCRAEIMSINMNFILLYLLDYGVDKIIPYSDYKELKMIPTKLSCFPALTYHCSLHGVMPDAGNSWSKDAINYCISFVENHDLMILPIKNLGKNLEEVSVYGQGSLAINLVKKGLAKEVDVGGKSEMIYHFPTLSSDTNPNLENIGYRGPSPCKNTLYPSKPNVHEESRQDCKAGFPLHQNCVQ